LPIGVYFNEQIDEAVSAISYDYIACLGRIQFFRKYE